MCLITNKCRRFFSTNQPRPFPEKKKEGTNSAISVAWCRFGATPTTTQTQGRSGADDRLLGRVERWRWLWLWTSPGELWIWYFVSEIDRITWCFGWNFIWDLKRCSLSDTSPKKERLMAEEVVFFQDDNYKKKTHHPNPSQVPQLHLFSAGELGM